MMSSAIFQLDLVWFQNLFPVFYHLKIWLSFSTLFSHRLIFYEFQQSKQIDSSFFMLLIGFSAGISNLFVYCYFGKLATDSFQKMADYLYESNWHELPINLQKEFVVMILNTQKPLHYTGFGIAVLNLETFLKVSRILHILKKSVGK